MAEKSIPEQIIDNFIDKLSKYELLKENSIESLKNILNSDNPRKQDIFNVIKENNQNENSQSLNQ